MTDKFLSYKILRKLNTGQVMLMGEEIGTVVLDVSGLEYEWSLGVWEEI